MAAIDELIDELRADGAVDSEGSFTLDREQARAKMQKFQLADARRYVLELVQAAVLRGAASIEFEIDSDDMRMRFDGAPFTEAELDDLYGSLFRDGEGRELQGLRQLALALNAALGMEPKYIHLRSGAAELRMRPGQRDELTAHDRVHPRTEIHVRQRVRPRLILDFFANLVGRLAEQQYLRDRCGYAQAAITLAGEPISRGLALEQPGSTSLELNGEGFEGQLELVPSHDGWTQLRLIKDGVWIDSRELPECGTKLVAVVAGRRLRKDVSQARIVNDDALGAIVDALRAQRWRLWAKVKAEAEAAGQLDAQLAELLRAQLLDHSELDELRANLDALALAGDIGWPDCRGQSARISLVDLVGLVDAGETPRFATTSYPELPVGDPPIPRLAPDEPARLERLLGVEPIEADSLLAREQLRARSRAAWLEREADPVLPTHVEFEYRGEISGAADIDGEVGIDHRALFGEQLEHPAQIMLYTQRRLLGRLEFNLDIPNAWLVVNAPFEPSEDYRDAVRDQTFIRALLSAIAALGQPLGRMLADQRDQVFEASARGLVKRWLIVLLDQPSQAAMVSSLGCDVSSKFYLPLTELLPSGEGPLEALAAAAPLLVEQPLFEQLEGPRLSLAGLAARAREQGYLEYVVGRPKDPRIEGPGVVVLGPGDRKIARALLGEDRCELFSTEAQFRRLRHLDQPPEDIDELAAQKRTLIGTLGVRAEHWLIELDGELRGFMVPAYASLGYELDALDEDEVLGDAKIAILHEGRPLCTVEVMLGFGPLEVLVESALLEPDELYEDVVADRGWDAMLDQLRAAATTLAAQLCETFVHETSTVQRWLSRVLVHAAAAGHCLDAADIDGLALLETVSGQTLSLADARAIIAEHGSLGVVSRETSWAPISDPEVIKVGEAERDKLETLLGAEQLVDASARVRRHRVFDSLRSNPAMREAKLGAAEVFVEREIKGEGREGVFGISRTDDGARLHLQLGTAGYQVLDSYDHDRGYMLAIEARVIDDEIPLDSDGAVKLESKRYKRLVRQIRRAVPALLLDLCADWDARPEDFRRDAWPHVLSYLEAESEDEERRRVREQALVAARAVPGFVDIHGRRHTLAQILDGRGKRAVRVLVELEPEGADALVDTDMILKVSPAELACLRAHTEVEVLDEQWEAELERSRWLAEAPVFERPEVEAIALVQRRAQVGGGLECELWLPCDHSPLRGGEPLQIVFIHDQRGGQREITRMAPLPLTPCTGVVSGPGLELRGSTVELDERQLTSLQRQALILYLDLARRLRDGLEGLEHERGLEYMARIDNYSPADLDALGSLGKRGRALREAAAELVPPTLRAAMRETPSPVTAPEEPAPEPATPEPVAPEPAAPEQPARARPSPAVARPDTSERAQPAATQMSADERLLAAIWEQLQWARARHGDVLDELRLAHLELRPLGSDAIAEVELSGIAINTGHRLIQRLLGQQPHDRFDLSFAVACIYTLMNHYAEEITDDDERLFVAQLAETLALSVRAARAQD